MSVAEIIRELSRLTAEERSAVRQRLRELEEKDEQLFLHEAADSMFKEMDKQETKNARRKAR
jgi:hypothetical protein